MTAEASVPNSIQPKTSGGFVNFVGNAITLIAFLLMALGLVAVTAAWRSHIIEFVGTDRVRITRSEWWGLAQSESVYRANAAGWVLLRENGDEVAVALQPIKVSD